MTADGALQAVICSKDRRLTAAVLPLLQAAGIRAFEGTLDDAGGVDVLLVDGAVLDAHQGTLPGRVVVRCAASEVSRHLDRALDFVLDTASPEEVSQRVWANLHLAERARPLRRLVRHDLRGPLTVVLGQAELLSLEVGGMLTEKQKRSVSAIDRQSEHLRELLDDLAQRLGEIVGWTNQP